MGILIVAIVGAIMGWLVSIVLDQHGSAVVLNSGAGALGGVIAAFLGGEVPLASGLSPTQLLYGSLGAALAIVVAVLTAYRAHVRTSRTY